MTSCFRRPSLSLMFLFWFGCDALLAFPNWWFCIAEGVKPLSPASSVAHAVFTGLGFLCYFGIASPLLYYPHLYRERLRLWDNIVNKPNKTKQYGKRTWRTHTMIGVWVSFLSALPRFCVELHIISTYGWLYVLQGVSIMITFLTIACGFLAVWGTFLWKTSKMFQTMSLNSMSYAEREEYLLAYSSGPYAVVYDARGFPVWAKGEGMPSFVITSWFYTYYPEPDQAYPEKEVAGHLSRGELREQQKQALEVRHPVGMAFVPAVVDPDLEPEVEVDFTSRGDASVIYPPEEVLPAEGPVVNPLSYIPPAALGMAHVGDSPSPPQPARSTTSTTQ
eukprot:TRINITY_DN74990_c0_g1_i1.p1 TRINITY_DN74990_c0_g1~~TRINITY_DN74990_c0_g1_i1.p1  ORF type:complete len:334 (+),score=63.35 TRINITY_DN74990_c0_g1_i1:161-1162(+)